MTATTNVKGDGHQIWRIEVTEMGMVSVTTALAVLPTNRPMAASKLTDHSSDAES